MVSNDNRCQAQDQHAHECVLALNRAATRPAGTCHIESRSLLSAVSRAPARGTGEWCAGRCDAGDSGRNLANQALETGSILAADGAQDFAMVETQASEVPSTKPARVARQAQPTILRAPTVGQASRPGRQCPCQPPDRHRALCPESRTRPYP